MMLLLDTHTLHAHGGHTELHLAHHHGLLSLHVLVHGLMLIVRPSHGTLMVEVVRDRVEVGVVGSDTRLVLYDVRLHLLNGAHVVYVGLLLLIHLFLLGIIFRLDFQLEHSNATSLGSQGVRDIVVAREEVDALSVRDLVSGNILVGDAALQPGADRQEHEDAGNSQDTEGPASGLLSFEVDFSPSSLTEPLLNRFNSASLAQIELPPVDGNLLSELVVLGRGSVRRVVDAEDSCLDELSREGLHVLAGVPLAVLKQILELSLVFNNLLVVIIISLHDEEDVSTGPENGGKR